MSPWTVYFFAVFSFVYPINYYFKTVEGKGNAPATIFLSIFWFTIPIVSLFFLTNIASKIKTLVKESKNDS